MSKQKIILKGIPASPGQGRGKVKIVRFQKEIAGLNPGDIIVTPFINSEFLSFIKKNSKISGIITDKGGITCHAAIVARELKIPYVAGTIKATKKLREDMVIDMDGEKGIIWES